MEKAIARVNQGLKVAKDEIGIRMQPVDQFLNKINDWRDRCLQWVVIRFFPLWITPNMLSGARIAGAPLTVYCLVDQISLWLTYPFFLFLLLTDALDGAVARARKITSQSGGFLDGFADKFLVCPIVAIALWEIDSSLIVLVCVGEFISFLLAVYALRKGVEVKSNICGKYKMGTQSFAILLILSSLPITVTIGDKVLWIALGLGAGSILLHCQTYLSRQ